MDVEMQIHDTIKALNATIDQFEHVVGHQDNEENIDSLSHTSRLNVFCDQIASSKLKQLETSTHVPFLPASKISLSIDLRTITHHIPSQIRKH